MMLLSGSTKRAGEVRLLPGSLPGDTTRDISLTNSLHRLDGRLPADGPRPHLGQPRETED